MRKPFSLAAACVLVVFGGCTAGPNGPLVSELAGVLFINEFMASNASVIADEGGDFDDWVELYNRGETDIDLSRVYLTDDLVLPMKWAFPDTFIPAGGYLLVWADTEHGEGWLHTSFKLNADPGEQLGLYATDGEHVFLVDTLSFGPQQTDVSFGRIPDGGDNWFFLSIPTPGAANKSGISPLNGVLFINEFLAANKSVIADERGDYDDWVELYNAGSTDVELLGLHLTDNLANPARWAFPDTFIPAGGYLIIWADGEEPEGPLHAGFSLSAASGEQLGLFSADFAHLLAVDTLSFGPQRTDTSFGRVPDGGTDWQYFEDPTPGGPNPGGM